MDESFFDHLSELCESGDENDLIELEKELWNRPAPDFPGVDVNQAYSRFYGVIQRGRLRRAVRYAVVACPAFALALVLGLWLGKNTGQAVPSFTEVVYSEIVSGHGDVEEITLYDGSRVSLNAETSLVYPESAGTGNRELYLRGEAVFEVAKDSIHPFVVHAGGCRIVATGTKFNVRSYGDEDQTTTTLVEGGVEVLIPGQTHPITLSPGMALAVGNRTSDVSLFKVADGAMPKWQDGEFNAYHLTLAQICRDMERRFGVKIMIADSRIASKVYYASFVNDEGVDGILAALNVRKDFRVRKQDSFYYIY